MYIDVEGKKTSQGQRQNPLPNQALAVSQSLLWQKIQEPVTHDIQH